MGINSAVAGFLLQVIFHRSRLQVTVLLIGMNKPSNLISIKNNHFGQGLWLGHTSCLVYLSVAW